MTLKKKVVYIALLTIILIIGGGAVYGFNIITGMSGAKLDESNLSVNELLDKGVVNIALFGVDGRDDVDGDRSDTIMIASMNFETGSIKITSVMRDLLVKIPESEKNDVSYEKINAAYDYGGAQLAVKTLNENFDLNISDYVVVNFDCLVDTVDALGGVEINIQSDDILYWTNEYINDVNDKVKKSDPHLEMTGPQTVTGVQALAYCRNRYSDSDYFRTERQREVVTQIAQKGMSVDLLTAINLIGKVYPYVSTSFTLQEMSTYAQAFLAAENKTMENFRVSTDELSLEDTINEIWYLVPNTLADNAIALHHFIYGTEVAYTPSDALVTISDHIAQIAGTRSGYTEKTEPTATTNIPSDNSNYNSEYSTPSAPESTTESTTPSVSEPTSSNNATTDDTLTNNE